MLKWIAIPALALTLTGCPKDDAGSNSNGPPPKPKVDPSKVVQVKTPVPYGKKVPCANILDPQVIGPIIGAAGSANAAALAASKAQPGAAPGKALPPWDVTLEEKTETDDRAASVCRVKRGGKMLSVEEAKKLAGKNAESAVLGILPGDEICQVTTYCWFPYNVDDAKKKCEKDGGHPADASASLGDFTCVEEVQAGDTYRYVLTIQDPKTQCTIKINPGPGATDMALSSACGKAALTIDPARNVPEAQPPFPSAAADAGPSK
jgi:hypothetical protein